MILRFRGRVDASTYRYPSIKRVATKNGLSL